MAVEASGFRHGESIISLSNPSALQLESIAEWTIGADCVLEPTDQFADKPACQEYIHKVRPLTKVSRNVVLPFDWALAHPHYLSSNTGPQSFGGW